MTIKQKDQEFVNFLRDLFNIINNLFEFHHSMNLGLLIKEVHNLHKLCLRKNEEIRSKYDWTLK